MVSNFNIDRKVLYDRDGIMVHKGPVDGSHYLVIGPGYLFLSRNVADEWLRDGIAGVEKGYAKLAELVDAGSLKIDYQKTPADVAFALSQARFVEERERADSLLGRLIKCEDTLSESKKSLHREKFGNYP